MSRFAILSIYVLTFSICFSQEDTSYIIEEPEIISSYKWQGPCYDNSGLPINKGALYQSVYEVPKFQDKIPISINIKAIQIGSETIKTNLKYKDKIQGETEIITLTDSVGIKLIVGKVQENGIKKYIHKLLVFKKEKETDCWRPLSMFNTYMDVHSKSMSINNSSIGYEESADYFKFIEGWIEFD